MHVKRLTLTSKKNWWMVELDEDQNTSANSFSSSEETAVEGRPPAYTLEHHTTERRFHSERRMREPASTTSPPVFNPPRHPASIFSFPTPTAYAAPPNATASLVPCAHGSASELFKCIVKKPDVVTLEINGDVQTNVSDVTIQFLAELRVYTTVARHRNICTFLGCLENVGLVLEYIDGRTLWDIIKTGHIPDTQKVDFHNQLLDGLTHLHSFGLSHGDLSLFNVQVTNATDTIKLLDFGRSVSADSVYTSPDAEPVDPFASLAKRDRAQDARATDIPHPTVEQIHPGTRPFSAPEILRGECQDARLADAYGFGIILVCLDKVQSVDIKPWDQRKDLIPPDFFEGCHVFESRARAYLKRWDQRRRLLPEDMI